MMTPRSFPFRTIATILTATTIGLTAHPAQSEVIFQSESNGTSFGVTIGGPNPGIEFSNAPIAPQYSIGDPIVNVDQSPQSFSNIYQYPSSNRPYQSHSNIFQYPQQSIDRPTYAQPNYYQNPRIIYRQPSVIYRRTEIVSPDGNQRVILEDPQYVIPNNGVIIHPDRPDYRHHHRRSNHYRRFNNSIYYRF